MPDKTYVLDYSDGQAFIQWPQPGVETIITARLKPDLGFPYAHLRFETATGQAFRTLDEADNDVLPLTEEEVAACVRYCEDYPIPGNYPVQAYEAETGLYMGAMLKSEAEAQGYAWIQGEDPDHPVSKLVAGEWVRIVALFKEDGHYRLMPDSTCPKCLVFLSQAEWDAWPKPTRSTEVWDFKTESWKDYRTLEQAKTTADDYIRKAYASKRRQLTGQIPAEERTGAFVMLQPGRSPEHQTAVAVAAKRLTDSDSRARSVSSAKTIKRLMRLTSFTRKREFAPYRTRGGSRATKNFSPSATWKARKDKGRNALAGLGLGPAGTAVGAARLAQFAVVHADEPVKAQGQPVGRAFPVWGITAIFFSAAEPTGGKQGASALRRPLAFFTGLF